MPASSDPSEARPRLYLIDGYSNIFRAFYAIRNLSNSRGEPTNAVFGFVQMLRKLLRDEKPELIGVALDVSSDTVRKDLYKEYKANRKPMPEDLRPQIPWIRRALEAYKIPILEYPKYEADDVLGTLAGKASDAGYEVVMVSADKDLMQLVSPTVKLFHTGRGKLYDPAGVTEDFGAPPEKVVDVLALMGDSADNVPGVPGIGAKGAQKLIREYGSVEELLDRAGEVSRKSYREGLQENRDQALLSKKLVTIHRDLPVEFDAVDLRHEEPDPTALRELFTELEFFSLADEIGSGESAAEVAAAREFESGDDFKKIELAANRRFPLALVTAPVKGELGEPAGLVCVGADGEPWWADFRRPGLREAVIEVVEDWLRDPAITLVGHDLKEILRLTPQGRAAKARLLDLMLISYLIKPSVHGHSLDELVLERLHRKLSTAREVGWDRGGEPAQGSEALLSHAGERALLTAELAPGMEEAIGTGELRRVYDEIEAPLVPVLVGMEERGILLDVSFLEKMSSELGRALGDLEEEIYDLADERFNINSPRQLGEILFEKLGLPSLKRTKKTKSYSTGAEVLEELAARGHEIAEKILGFREMSKLKSTYVDALPALVAEDGRLHTRFNQAVAATGRLSSANPNLQNIPVRTELGQRIRKAFVAPPGRMLLVADYSQIELRVLAHIAGEEALLKAFRAGGDIHAATAAAVLGVAPDLVTAEQRRAAKTINFGIIYGMSAFGLSKNLHISPKEAQSFIDSYFDRYPGVRRYMEETTERAKEKGRVETLYGRVRWLPDIQSKNFNLRENARRMAINARIQGTAADLMKLALLALAKRLGREAPGADLLLTVHDEVVLEVPEKEVEKIATLVREEMEGVADLDAPLVVDTGWGKSWYEAKE